jgi:nucleotide-binding universal stress UspA family protein
MKTLLATDGSKDAKTALLAASRLLKRRDNEFYLTCVVPEARATTTRTKYLRKISGEAARIINASREVLRSENITAESITKKGSPADVLIGMAEDYDVVVIGAHGRHERTQPGLGPVASRVVERARGVVLVGREVEAEKNFRILVAVDGSQAAQNALDTLKSTFEFSGAEVTLMHVVEMPWLHLGLDEDWLEEPAEGRGDTGADSTAHSQLDQEVRHEAQQVIDAALAQVKDYPFSISTVIEEGNPASQLLRQAEVGEYDLVIVGATGVSDLKHVMLGSVSVKVAWNAPCSVAVVR